MSRRGKGRPKRRRTSVLGMALTGFAIAMAGVVWGIVTVRRVGDEALAKDDHLLVGPLLLVGIGSILLVVARIRKMLAKPVEHFAHGGAEKAVESFLENL